MVTSDGPLHYGLTGVRDSRKGPHGMVTTRLILAIISINKWYNLDRDRD